jgi:nitronate monooxygenase
VATFVAKGGKIEDTVGRKCLCNALMANIGHAQTRNGGGEEPALVTAGDDLNSAAQFLTHGRSTYGAADVVESLLSLVRDDSPVNAESLVTVEAEMATA